jgi:hypothetical protein
MTYGQNVKIQTSKINVKVQIYWNKKLHLNAVLDVCRKTWEDDEL